MWVLAAVLALVCLLLLSPLCLRFTLFDGEAAFEIRFLLFHWRMKAEKEEKKGAPAERKKGDVKKPAAKKPKKEKRNPLSGRWDGERLRAAALLLRDLLTACGQAGRFLLKKIRLHKLWIEIMVVRPDACQTAAESGKLNAWFCGALALLQNYLKPESLYLNIYPGFWAPQETAAVDAALSLTPARILGAAGLLLIKGAKPLFTFIRLSQNQDIQPPAPTPEAEGAAGNNTGKEGI